MSALVAGAAVDRVYAAREGLSSARERRAMVLDVLRDRRPPAPEDELGMLRPDRCPVPFRGRSRELARL